VLYSRRDGCWKLTDFGSASVATSKGLVTTSLPGGTASYWVPEVLKYIRATVEQTFSPTATLFLKLSPVDDSSLVTGQSKNTLKKGIQFSVTNGLLRLKAPVFMILGSSLQLCSLWNREKDQVRQSFSSFSNISSDFGRPWPPLTQRMIRPTMTTFSI